MNVTNGGKSIKRQNQTNTNKKTIHNSSPRPNASVNYKIQKYIIEKYNNSVIVLFLQLISIYQPSQIQNDVSLSLTLLQQLHDSNK